MRDVIEQGGEKSDSAQHAAAHREVMKIAVIAPFWNPPNFRGGISRVVFELRRQWQKAGHTVHVFAYDTAQHNNVDVVRIPVPRMPLRVVFGAVWVRMTGRLEGYDIVFPQSAMMALLVNRDKCVPFVHTLSNVEARSWWRPWRQLFPMLERAGLRDLQRCLTLSPDTRQQLIRKTGMPAAGVRRVANGVDTALFRPASADAPAGHPPTLLAAGRFIPRKRFSLALHAFAGLGPGHANWQFVLAGDGPLTARLQGEAAELGISDRVRFVGLLNEQELLAAYRSSDLFVLPSDAEGLPMVVLEAMACELPVMLGNFATAAELTAHGSTGVVVDSDDPAAWTAALVQLVDDALRRRQMGSAGRELVTRRYAWPVCADRILAEFESALEPG